jgi:hypothetical protein
MPSTPSHSENSEDSEQSHNSEESEDSGQSHNSEESEDSEQSHNSERTEISVHEGHVALVLLPVERNLDGSNFYLEIPIDIINSLCLKPRKYLRFLGWCILGNTGKLSFERGGEEIDNPEGGVQDREVYYYVMSGIYGASHNSHSQHCCHSCIVRNALFRSQTCCRPSGYQG